MRETIPRALDGERVDRVVALLSGLPRAEAARLVAEGGVSIGGHAVATRSRRVSEGDVLDVRLPDSTPEPGPPCAEPGVEFAVVWADPHVVVVDKPAGLVVHPGAGHQSGTLVNGLLARFPDVAGAGDPQRPGIVHRLDAGTSGLLVVARTPLAYASLVAQLARRAVERRYLALVWGEVEAPEGVIDAPLGRSASDRKAMAVVAGGRLARTRYRVRQRFSHPAPLSLLECQLETGRTHQIRVHLAAIGHPVVGDVRYRGQRRPLVAGRPFLHAFHLAFDHPLGGERRRFDSPLPPDLEVVRASVR